MQQGLEHYDAALKLVTPDMSNSEPRLVPPCSLPEEIWIQIVLNLRAVDILACKMVCRWMCDRVASTAAVQYKSELDAAGMIDGVHRPDFSLANQLERLKNYHQAWLTSELSFHPNFRYPTDGGFFEPWWASSGDVLSYVKDFTLKLTRLPSKSRGVPDRVCDISPETVSLADVAWCAVDLAQDLVVLSQKPEEGGRPECHLLCIGERGAPHPRAATSVLYGSITRSASAHADHIQILGDLIGWHIRGRNREMRVWNWKTGVLLWWYCYKLVAHFYIIDARHVLLVDGYQLRVYAIDPLATTSVQKNLSIRKGGYLCILQPPPLAREVKSNIFLSDAKITPAASPDYTSAFAPDSALSIVAVLYHMSGGSSRSDESGPFTLLLLIPISTVLATVRRLTQNADGPEAQSTIPWDAWGPAGTRCVQLTRLPFFLSAAGCRVALCYHHAGVDPNGTVDVLIFDVHPSANVLPSGFKAQAGLSTFARAIIKSPSDIAQSRLYAAPIRTSLPYRVTCRNFFVGTMRSTDMMLMNDGLALMLRNSGLGLTGEFYLLLT